MPLNLLKSNWIFWNSILILQNYNCNWIKLSHVFREITVDIFNNIHIFFEGHWINKHIFYVRFSLKSKRIFKDFWIIKCEWRKIDENLLTEFYPRLVFHVTGGSLWHFDDSLSSKDRATYTIRFFSQQCSKDFTYA